MWLDWNRYGFMNSFPALLIGGPPHSGKTTLAYSLSQALRARRIAHYLLRAAPDGEGDWSHEVLQAPVQPIRFKGAWTRRWVEATCRDIAHRTLPLLVDVGGKPTADQEAIFDQCTHAIVIAADDAQRAHWASLVRGHNLQVIADLRSSPGPAAGDETGAARGWALAAEPISGTITGLVRDRPAPGPIFQAVAERAASIFAPFTESEVFRIHLATAPFRNTAGGQASTHLVHFRDLQQALHPEDPSGKFVLDRDIQPALDRIPTRVPTALYGRAPVRLVAAIAAHRDVQWQFDARLGWLRTPPLAIGAPGDLSCWDHASLAFEVARTGPHSVTLQVRLKETYLDYDAMLGLRLPYIPPDQHVTLGGPEGGKLPQWLVAGMAIAYRYCAGVSAWQPQQQSDR